MIFIGNPFSAAATAPELLPEPVGGLGQLLPPGAGANLLRSTGFFDGAGSVEHIAVLAVWAGLGLAADARHALVSWHSHEARVIFRLVRVLVVEDEVKLAALDPPRPQGGRACGRRGDDAARTPSGWPERPRTRRSCST